MRAFVRETKREIKAVRAKNAELEKDIETIDDEWRVHDVRVRLDEIARLNYQLEMIRQEKRPCERRDCTDTRRKYKEATNKLNDYS